MDLVIDANILFAALIKKSITARLLFHPDLQLYAPEFLIEEFMGYSALIQQKMKRSRSELVEILHVLQEVITIVSQEEYAAYMKEAEELSPDDKDVMYFALALKLKCGFWSNDGLLKEQSKVKIYTTPELLKELRE